MNNIHFVRLDRDGNYHEFMLIHYLSIKSFAVQHPEANIYLHINRKFFSKWYTLLKEELGDQLHEVMHEITEWDRFDCVSHVCDALKLDILQKYGGLAVDTDFICIRPVDDLLDSTYPVNICEERDPISHHFTQIVIGFISGKSCKFIKDWIEKYKSYEKGKSWTYYAGQVPTEMWKSGKYDDQINVIPESMIDPFSYTRDGMADLFLHNYDVPYAYMVHTAESVVWDRFLKPLDLEHIMTVNTTFTKLARPYVEHLWDKSNNKSLFR